MSLLLFRYGSRRCLSVFKTKVPPSPSTNRQSVVPTSKLSNEKYVKAYQRAEDVDQKRVTVPVNPDLFPANTQTHTGQVYDADDYRNVRFINKGKLVRSSHQRIHFLFLKHEHLVFYRSILDLQLILFVMILLLFVKLEVSGRIVVVL